MISCGFGFFLGGNFGQAPFRFEFKKMPTVYRNTGEGALAKPLKLGFKATDNWLVPFECNEKIYSLA